MNFRRVVSYYFIALIGLTIPMVLFQVVPLLIGLWVLAGVFFFIPTVIPNCGLFASPIHRFQTQDREVWLTIDDGPDPIDTPQILALLAQHRAVATFFVIGSRAKQYPELLHEIIQQGHTIANHTFTHPLRSFWIAYPSWIEREIDRCSDVILKGSGKSTSPFFRPPVGMINFFLPPILEKRGLHLVGWSARGYDAVNSDPEGVVSRILKKVSPGSIILLHEGHHQKGSDQAVNPRCLALLLERLSVLGYACVLPRHEQIFSRSEKKCDELQSKQKPILIGKAGNSD